MGRQASEQFDKTYTHLFINASLPVPIGKCWGMPRRWDAVHLKCIFEIAKSIRYICSAWPMNKLSSGNFSIFKSFLNDTNCTAKLLKWVRKKNAWIWNFTVLFSQAPTDNEDAATPLVRTRTRIEKANKEKFAIANHFCFCITSSGSHRKHTTEEKAGNDSKSGLFCFLWFKRRIAMNHSSDRRGTMYHEHTRDSTTPINLRSGSSSISSPSNYVASEYLTGTEFCCLIPGLTNSSPHNFAISLATGVSRIQPSMLTARNTE